MAEISSVAGIAAPIVPSGGSVALKSAPKVEINVSALPKTIAEGGAPKPGGARERMNNDLKKAAGLKVEPPKAPTKEPKAVPKAGTDENSSAAPAKSAAEESADHVEESSEEPKDVARDEDSPEESAEPAVEKAKVPPGTEKKKANPWELLKAEKKARADAEARIAETEKRAIPQEKWKETEKKIADLEKYKSELEEEIRYKNYEKHPEFKEKFDKPYVDSWQRAMGELGDLTVQDTNGQTRPINTSDMLELVNLPLQRAHEMAVEKFGELAPEVMAHRKEIKKLADERNNALERERKNGATREKEMTDKQQREFGALRDEVVGTWSKANEEALNDPKYGIYFKPRDGDEQGNQRLAKGYEMADRAFNEDPRTPGLTSEQRQGIVKRHAAVRNRSAAFGRLVHENGLKDAKISELNKTLAEYKGSEPDLDGSAPPPKDQQPGPGGRKASMFSALHKLAKDR